MVLQMDTKSEPCSPASPRERRDFAGEEYYSRIVSSLSFGIIVFDGNGIVRSVNPFTESLTGYDDEEMVGKRLASFLHLRPLHGSDSLLFSVESGLLNHPLFLRDPYAFLMGKNGEERLVYVTLSRLSGMGAENSDMVLQIEDLSNRPDVLENSLEFLEAINQAADCIVITDAQYVVRFVNPSFTLMTGHSQGEIIDQPFSNLINGASERQVTIFQAMFSVLEQGKSWSGTQVCFHNDGESKDVLFSASPVRNFHGEMKYFVFVIHDMTDRIRLEKLTSELNLIDNIGHIFAGIRHEIGNPLNSIKMSLDVLLKNFQHFDSEKIEEYLTISLKEIRRIEKIFRSLRGYHFLEQLTIKPILLSQFFTDFLSILTRDLEKKGITLSLSFGEEDTRALLDENAFHQVMLNLITNSIDALELSEFPRIEVVVRKQTPYVIVTIHDNGCGIPSENLKHLFKPFYSTKSKGTGLGLVIIKKLVTRMNGLISLESSRGEGTTVRLVLTEG